MGNESRNKKLTVKQENFCNYYLEEGGNASAAYRRAYGCVGWSDKAVWTSASELLNTPKVAVRVTELREELKAKSDVTKEEVVKLLASVVRGEKINDFSKTTKGKSGDGEIEMEVTQTVSVEWAVGQLSKMLGFNAPEKHELTGKGGKDLISNIQVEIIDRREQVETNESE